jgi:hypothetical protein
MTQGLPLKRSPKHPLQKQKKQNPFSHIVQEEKRVLFWKDRMNQTGEIFIAVEGI